MLLALALLAWWVVHLGLRPLEQMGETAGAIAAGDLSRRVETADERTEVGRLGLALNSMLGQIEGAFAERTASEARLRRFVADAAHELRTPLTSIRGYAELFRRGASTRPDDLAKTMRRIEEGAARMGVLVEDLLLLARLDQGRPLDREPVDLTRLTAAAVDDLRVVSPDRPVVYESNGAVVVNGDEHRLRQVLANLLENARTHTPPDDAGGGARRRVRRRRGDRGARPRAGHDARGRRRACSSGSGAPTRRGRATSGGAGPRARDRRRDHARARRARRSADRTRRGRDVPRLDPRSGPATNGAGTPNGSGADPTDDRGRRPSDPERSRRSSRP